MTERNASKDGLREVAGGEKHDLSSRDVQLYRKGTLTAAAKEFRYRFCLPAPSRLE